MYICFLSIVSDVVMPYTSRIPEIIAALEINVSNVVQKAGFRVEAGAKSRARVDTGNMRRLIRWIPTGPFSGTVEGGAHYTIYNEFGWTRTYPNGTIVSVSAQPMFIPAVEVARPIFQEELVIAINSAVNG